MPDDITYSPQMPDDQVSWFTKNRKIVILGAIVIVLAVVAGVTAVLRPKQQATNNASSVNTTNQATNTNTGYSRPTFQRSTIANVSTAPPESYQPPTTSDLQKAINALPK